MSTEKPQEVASQPAAETADDAGTFVGSNSPSGGSKRGSQSEKFLIMFALSATIFLLALDQTIVSTAAPTITNQFNALQDVGWYGSAYLLTATALQPMFGRIYSFFSLKWVFVIALTIFEIGSLICAVAQNSPTLIVGRAIAGIGLAGGYIGIFIIIAACTPVSKRAIYSSLIAVTYGGGAICGPILGGVFTSTVTWRWCFWINLPCGGVILAMMILSFKPPVRVRKETMKHLLIHMDWIGTTAILASVICILLVLQWGGITYAWGSSQIIGLLVGSALLFTVFVGDQIYLGDGATLVPRVFKFRSIWTAGAYNFCYGSYFFTITYFVPIYFQAVKDSTALISGVQTIPMIVGVVIFSTLSGIIVTKLGYYTPVMMVAALMAVAGGTLLHEWEVHTGHPAWIGYQFLAGSGSGLGFNLAFVAAQTVSGKDTDAGTTIVIFLQTLGGTLMTSIAQSIYQNTLKTQISSIPGGPDALTVIEAGVSGWRTVVPAMFLEAVAEAQNTAVTNAFVCAIAAPALAFIMTAGIEWKSIRGGQEVPVGGA
ncbi:MFS general substrate transporter [Ceraceosorus guamensis]|uniref:MFS general substrate transporter n=1 Tax=Ceraceosorus guamensis TaxID=1522189 RepID=A0A316VUK0_9BASI|nr:MFS general substrate transporter [Ceraceosorus guamensis]PWN39185.1 MFS general substrate transporter [Ceraceosorus guamensis]